MDAGDSRLFHMTRREVTFLHLGPRPNSLDSFTQFVSRQKLGSKAGSTITGLPAFRVKSLAKSSLTLVECRPSLALVASFRMVLQALMASC